MKNRKSNKDFAGVCERIVELAIERAEQRPGSNLEPDDLP